MSDDSITIGGLTLRVAAMATSARSLKVANHACRAYAFGDPGRGFSLYPLQRLKTGFEFVDLLNCAVRPFGLDLPLLALS